MRTPGARLPSLALLALTPLAANAKAEKAASDSVPASSATVPLYGGVEAADPFLYVEAMAGDKPLLLRLDSGSAQVHLSKAAGERLGLKVGKSTTSANAHVAALGIGEVSLADVAVWVDDAVEPAGDLPVDGSVGLLAFPGVSWTVLPSKGTVTLGPGSAGPEMVAALAGGTVGVAGDLTVRKRRVGAEKHEYPSGRVALPVTVSGVPLTLVWATAAQHTILVSEIDGTSYALVGGAKPPKVARPLPAAPGRWDGPVRVEARLVDEIPAEVRREGGGSAWLLSDSDGLVGIDVAQHFDLAVDNAWHTAAVRRADAIRKADYGDRLEARLKAEIPAADGTDATNTKREAALGAYADFLESRSREGESLLVRKEIAEASPDGCDGWLRYGEALLSTSAPQEAAVALTRAQALYAPWAQKPLADRSEVEEAKARTEKRGDTWSGEIPQPSACYVATGRLAAAKLLLHDYAGIAALYSQLDLDAGLARVAGTAALAEGKEEEAQARFRQAQKLHGVGDDDGARIGLYLAYRHTNPRLANEQLEASRFQYEGHTDPLVLSIWVEDQRARGGALEALQALAASSPTDPVLLAALVAEERHAVAASADPTATAAVADADALRALAAFDRALDAAPRDGRLWADYALFLVAEHKDAEAGKAADLAMIFSPSAGETWYAAAGVAAMGVEIHEGGVAFPPSRIGEALERAGVVGFGNPAYAMLAL